MLEENNLEKKFQDLKRIMDEWVKVYNKGMLELQTRMKKMDEKMDHDYSMIGDLKEQSKALRIELSRINIVLNSIQRTQIYRDIESRNNGPEED